MMKLKNKLLFTGVVFILVTAHILWDYFNGGVATHYVLANENLPGISNWWGMLTVPILTWICLSLIFKNSEARLDATKVRFGFFASLCFGIILSLLWELDLEVILQYLIFTPMIVALAVKVHKPECLLGFVLGMTYTFGGVLPIMIGLVLLILSFLIHVIFNQGVRYLMAKLKKGKPKGMG